MGQLINITNITSAVAGTLGVDALTGWTRYEAHESELPEGSVSSAYLVQTNPAVAPTFRLDNSATVFAGGSTYHRVSFWLKLMKYDEEVTSAPTNYPLASHQFSFGGTITTVVSRFTWVTPDSGSARYTGSLGGFVFGTPVGSFGTESNICHNAAGCSFNASGVADQTSNYAAPNFPIAEWVRVDVAVDLNTLRYKMFLNGQMISMTSLKIATTPCVVWTFTPPVITGFVWALECMSSWADTNPSNDTGLTVLTNDLDWKTWGVPPTFGNLNDVQARFILPTPANGAWAMIPYSIASGNDPQRIQATFTSSGADAVATFEYSPQPMEYDDNGIFVVDTHIRLGQADTGSGTAGQGITAAIGFGLGTSFEIEYTGGHYVMTDYAGTILGTWDLNEIVNWKLSFTRNGPLRSTIFNQSKNSCTTAASTSAVVTIDPDDELPTTTFGLLGSFSATASGAKVGIESLNGFKRDTVLLVDSFTNAPANGTAAGVVTLWASACRESFNRISLLQVANGQADSNVAGLATFPYGPNTPRISFSVPWGRSGNKLTAWYTNNIANGALNDWYGSWVYLFGGITNELAAVSDEATSISVARTVADAIVGLANHRLNRGGGFVWHRTPIPPLRPSTGLPSASFETIWKRDCFFRIDALAVAELSALRRSNPNGAKCMIVDGGAHDFDDVGTGVHPGVPGTGSAFVAAYPQLASLLGESYMNGGGEPIPAPSSGGGGRRRSIIPIQC